MTELTPVRLLVVEDHQLFRRAVLTPLHADPRIDVVGTAPDGMFALQFCATANPPPEVLLLDLNMPHMDGLTLLAQLADTIAPPPHCLILTADADPASAFAAFTAGARGYLLKDNVTDESLCNAVLAVADGGIYVDETIFAGLLQTHSLLALPAVPDQLTDLAEMDRLILRDVALGYDNKEIAVRQHVSTKTVSNRLSRLYSTLSLTNRVQAALFALRNGMAQLSDQD